MSYFNRLLLFGFMFYTSGLFAGGLRLTEVGTPDMGVASAGAAAVARDAGTVYFNPAGMTRFERPQLLLGSQITIIDTKFSDKGSRSLFRGGNGNQAGTVLPVLGMYYTRGLCKNLKTGLSINSSYGGSFNYGRTWKGRYMCQRVFLPILEINPALAYKISPCWSIGAGFVAQWGYFANAFALNPAVFGGNPLTDQDGRAEINMDSFAYGFNVGVLYELSSCTRLGLTYRSKLRHNFTGRLLIEGPSRVFLNVDTLIKFADYVIGSIYHQLTCKVALLASLGWERWSVFDRTLLTSDDLGSFNIPRNWNNTWHGAIGIEYRWCDPLLLQAGFSYDSSPTKASDRLPDLPIDRQLRYSVGAIYECNRCEKLSFAISYLDGRKAPIDAKRPDTPITLLKGHYTHNGLYFANFCYNRIF